MAEMIRASKDNETKETTPKAITRIKKRRPDDTKTELSTTSSNRIRKLDYVDVNDYYDLFPLGSTARPFSRP